MMSTRSIRYNMVGNRHATSSVLVCSPSTLAHLVIYTAQFGYSMHNKACNMLWKKLADEIDPREGGLQFGNCAVTALRCSTWKSV